LNKEYNDRDLRQTLLQEEREIKNKKYSTRRGTGHEVGPAAKGDSMGW